MALKIPEHLRQMLTDAELRDFATFEVATIGMRAYDVARKLNKLTPDYDWRGGSKSDMAYEYAIRNCGSGRRLAAISDNVLRSTMAGECATCHRKLDQGGDPSTNDCGGECRQCTEAGTLR